MDSNTAASSATIANQRRMQAIVDNLNKMRMDQRVLSHKMSELESEATEHRLVIDALKEVDKSRICYRLVGGILIKQTVQEVLPDLEKNVDMLKNMVETYRDNVKSKGQAINEYIQQNQLGSLIRLQNAASDASPTAESSSNEPDDTADHEPKSSVLVE